MSPEIILFAKKYRWFLRIFSLWVVCTPERWRPTFIFTIGRWLNPFERSGDKIRRAMCLALPGYPVERAWRDWLNSHVRFVLDFLTYNSFDADWLEHNVVVSDPGLLASLRNSGGLLLTYHSHHQNTLCCALGLEGIKISAIAALPEDSPLFPFIGHWAQRVNAESARFFKGGSYIFTSNLRALVRTTRMLLADREVVVCLCDLHQPKMSNPSSAKFFDRLISPPTGTIEIAIKHGAPVYAAMFAPKNGKLVLKLKQLDDSGGVDAIVAEYFSFLESCIRSNPVCWQGWEWFEDIPLAEQTTP